RTADDLFNEITTFESGGVIAANPEMMPQASMPGASDYAPEQTQESKKRVQMFLLAHAALACICLIALGVWLCIGHFQDQSFWSNGMASMGSRSPATLKERAAYWQRLALDRSDVGDLSGTSTALRQYELVTKEIDTEFTEEVCDRLEQALSQQQ